MVTKTKENGKYGTPENALGALEFAMAGDSKTIINKNVDNKNVDNIFIGLVCGQHLFW